MGGESIRALVVTKLGNPRLPLSHEDCPVSETSWPRPALETPTSVRVQVAATSVNFSTVLQIQGSYQEKYKLPFVLGGDFSGTVIEVGEKVKKFKVGDSVIGFIGVGCYATELVARENDLFLVPAGCGDIVSLGGFAAVFGTTHVALTHRANLQPGQVLLVLGAAGGVGLAAVQLGKLLGATVIAAATGKEKIEVLKTVGADFVLDPNENGLIKPVQEFLKSKGLKGVDVLYDPVGGKQHKESLKLLKWSGHMLLIGFASGEIPSIPANIALVKNWTIHGFYWGSYKMNQPQIIEDSFAQLLSWVAEGKLQVHVSDKYPLSEANLAFAKVMDRKAIGKVLLTFDNPVARL